MTTLRERRDQCPGVLRPWPARDGLLVRLRLIGGRLSAGSLRALSAVADEYGDGRIHVTTRANLQVRGLPGSDGRLSDTALAAVETTGLLPSRTHELVRNVMVSPQTGLAGGRADLRDTATQLDARLRGSAELATLPGRFLFVLDDGRGDLVDRGCDLGLVALDHRTAQLRIGAAWGDVVPLAEAPEHVAGLATRFARVRGAGPDAPWHVTELARPLADTRAPVDDLPTATPPLTFGAVPGGVHVPVPTEGLSSPAVGRHTSGLTDTDELIVTPWRGLLIPGDAHD